jgi:5-methylcytosine-specific restriction endonuclease McrA
MLNSSVLLLNQNYVPLNICPARRAVILVWRGKAEILESDSRELRSASQTFSLPSVIRLVYMVKRPRPHLGRLTRQKVFLRDRYTCQYCGKQTSDLTIDHVIPRHLGGKHSWDNVVSACKACNYRKAGKSFKDAGMKLLHAPAPPTFSGDYVIYRHFDMHPGWEKYFPHGKQK